MVLRISLLACVFFLSYASRAHDSTSYYLIYLKDKQLSEYHISRPGEFLSQQAIERRIKKNISIQYSDLPVSGAYIRQVSAVRGVRIIHQSKWLNAIEISSKGKSSAIDSIRALPCVSGIEFLGRIKDRHKPAIEPVAPSYHEKARNLQKIKNDLTENNMAIPDHGKSSLQSELIGIDRLHGQTYGNGVHIAVFDAGFFNAYQVPGMEDLLMPDVIIRDFVDYDNSVWEDDRHGANVLGFMKTFSPGRYIGSAPLARYTLVRTENPTSEYPTEEVNWLFGAEFADSLGVDLIVSSLGYHTFDDPSLSHTHAQLDGKTSIVARAANFAYEKGIMLVTSAGNEGGSKWRRIGTPSDAPGVIGIGACDKNGFHAGFSSYGPSADGRVKPDFLSLGQQAMVASPAGFYQSNGTSYATPIVGGAVACLMAAFPDKTREEIRNALMQSATHFSQPDSAYGYGLADFNLAMNILGKFNDGRDTSGDFLYTKTSPVFFQDMGIHFRSKTSQKVRITIKGLRKKRLKSILKMSYVLEAGEWLHDSTLLSFYKKESRKKRKHKVRELIVSIETSNGSFLKTIHLHY